MIRFNNPAQGASYMLKRGFKPFPINAGAKTPAVKDWQGWANVAKKGTIDTYLLSTDDSNWGIVPALSGHMVLDIDSGYKLRGKKIVKAQGDETLEALIAEHGPLPKTFTVQTPSGGLHLYFIGTCRPTQSTVGEGIDTRSIASYVVAPGSICKHYTADGKKEDGVYAILEDCDPVECPTWLLDLLEAEKPNSAPLPDLPAATKEMLDTPLNVKEAIDYLQRADICEEGNGKHGGEYLLTIFMELRDRGITPDIAKDLVLEHYNDRCDPPWNLDDPEHLDHFEKKLHNAYNYAKNPIGALSPEVKLAQAKQEFTHQPIDENPKEGEPQQLLPLFSSASIDIIDIPKREWIIQHQLCRRYISVLGAPGGVGKSTFEVLRALCIVTGKQLMGERFPVEQKGPVILYNLEDPLDELMRKIEAARIKHNLTKADIADIHLISGRDHGMILCSTNGNQVVTNKAAIKVMIATANSIGAVFISFDPLVRTHWVNENDNGQMDKVVRAIQQISSHTNCAISLVHHARKGGGNSKAPTNSKAVETDDNNGDQDIFRGAGSLLSGARFAHVIETMGEDAARRLGIDVSRRKFYFKLMEAKNNMSAPAEHADWYEKSGVEIGNGEIIGVCARSELNVIAQMKKAEMEEKLRLEGIHFLQAHIPVGSERTIAELQGMAVKDGVSFADMNTPRFVGKIEGIIFGVEEYTMRKGKKGAWVLARAEGGDDVV